MRTFFTCFLLCAVIFGGCEKQTEDDPFIGLSIYNSARDGEHRGVPGAKEAVDELSPRFRGAFAVFCFGISSFCFDIASKNIGVSPKYDSVAINHSGIPPE